VLAGGDRSGRVGSGIADFPVLPPGLTPSTYRIEAIDACLCGAEVVPGWRCTPPCRRGRAARGGVGLRGHGFGLRRAIRTSPAANRVNTDRLRASPPCWNPPGHDAGAPALAA